MAADVKAGITRVEGWGLTAAFLFGFYSLMQAIPPASWWFEVNSIVVADLVEGEPALITVDRRINRDFTGVWRVEVRKLDPATGQWVSDCVTAETRQSYITDAALPHPVTLDWWASDECGDVDPGTYYIATFWRINPDGLMPRSLQVTSPVFKVLPRV